MDALYDGQPFDVTDRPESVQNLVQRYRDLETCFPEELREAALPYFIDWLLENVHLVEITAYSDDDAYTIFETMNDRGLSLSPTEAKRTTVNTRWRPHPRTQRCGQGSGIRLLQGVAPQPARHQDPRAQERRKARGLRPHWH